MWRIRLTIVPVVLLGLFTIPHATAHATRPGTHTSAANSLGYNLVTNSQICPGLPANQVCTQFSPSQVTLFLHISDIPCCSPPNGRVGSPVELDLSCIHYTTKNGVTTAQLGVAEVDQSGALGRFAPGSLAGILSPDTATTWRTDKASAAFINVQGRYIITNVSTSFRIRSFEIVDNASSTGTAGGVTVTVSGTLLNYKYTAGHFTLIGYSQGQISCMAQPVPPRTGQFWSGFNQVFSYP